MSNLKLKNRLTGRATRMDAVPNVLPLRALVPFTDHQFRTYEGQRLDDMVASIEANGVLVPVIVRPVPGDDAKYEILSGHNRVKAAGILGHETISAIIRRDLTDDEALIIVVETNALQRSLSEMLPSERAAIIHVRHGAISNQGKRTDLIREVNKWLKASDEGDCETSGTEFRKSDSRGEIGEQYGLSGRAIADYLRIYELNRPLKDLLDDGRFGIKAGVNLSYIPESEMTVIADILEPSSYNLDTENARFLREMSGRKALDRDTVKEILAGTRKRKPGRPPSATIKLEQGLMAKYFGTGMKQTQIKAIVAEALELWWNTRK